MTSVIGNGGMGSIKKQIFLSLGLFFSCSNLSAMCPQTVGPVLPGESLWQVTSRIGQATNVIESQICALSGDIGCSFTFGQADIGVGNIYTISAPGVYCMKETVTFSVGTAITIASSDVTIDMQGHTLNGAGGGNVGIRLGNFISNVIIQNGTIENINATFGSTAIRDTTAALVPVPYLVNVAIKNINFNNNDFGITVDAAGSTGIYTDGLFIENCKFFGSINSDINVHSISTIVRECLLQTQLIILEPIPSPFAINGTKQVVVEDCVISSTSTSQIGFLQAIADTVVIRDCIVQGPFYQGIAAAGSNVTISDCILQGGDKSVATNGINLTNSGAALIERCFVANNATGFYISNAGNSLKLVDCVAESNRFNGFYFNTPVSKITVQGCSAEANGINGFVIQNNSTGNVISQLIFENCVAQGNSGDGFSLVNADPGSSISEVTFMNCVSQRNLGGTDGTTIWLGDGFGIGSASTNAGPIYDISCQNCFAQRNAHDGLNFASTVTLGKILDCCAMDNTGTGINSALGATTAILGNSAFNNGTDIAGVVDPTLLISRSFPGGLAGATRWVNAIS
jgi:hypothetical protein